MSLLSPGIQVNELDLSLVASNAGTTNGAFGGKFLKGYSGKPVLVNSVQELIDNFGKPNNSNFNDWYQAYYFLQYTNGLYLSRAVDENGHWLKTKQKVDKVTNIGKVQIQGNPDDIFVGSIVKFNQDSDQEFLVKEIELPQKGQKAKGEITITTATEGHKYSLTINGTKFEYTYTATTAGTPLASEVATGLSNVINLPGLANDSAQGDKILLETENPGVALVVAIDDKQVMSYSETQEPLPVENYELVLDDADEDFSTIAVAGATIFKKNMSKNAIRFLPIDSTEPTIKDLKPLDATKQIQYEQLIQNEDEFDVINGSIMFPENYKLKVIARTFGEHGNDIEVCIAREADFTPTGQCFSGISITQQDRKSVV